MAAATIPFSRISAAPKSASCSSLSESVWTLQAPESSVKYTWRPSWEGVIDHSLSPSCWVNWSSPWEPCISAKISGWPVPVRDEDQSCHLVIVGRDVEERMMMN